jgi:photosystem II stability/assembly factor-like uncharacterized protein
MKNLILITIVLLIGSSISINAQWYSQNNPAQNNSLNDIFVFDENNAIIVGDHGTILRTIDGGENWLYLPHDTTDWLSSVYFVNDNIGCIVGGLGIIKKTTDGGNSWIGQLYGGCCLYLSSVYFVDENNGWVVGVNSGDGPPSGIIYKTTDGGINWIYNAGLELGQCSSVFFVNIDTGWVVGSSWGACKLLKTTNSGEMWVEQGIGLNSWPVDVYFIDENIGWTVWADGSILKTTDGGENWINQPSGFTNYLYSVQFVNQSTGWAVGTNGIILNTKDGGINWISQPSGTSNDLYSINFANENAGWVVGENGTILKTINGGGTIPVELTSFTASAQSGYIELNWSTATEINNLMFEIERSKENSDFVSIGFVEGNGTTTEEHHYNFMDKDVSGFLRYRLKQVDFDGSYEYSGIIEVEALGNFSYELSQNYPNPLNPSTTISFSIPNSGLVTFKVYDVLGNEVATLVNEEKPAGSHSIEFNASRLVSGIYFYTINAGDFVETKKMILLR